ncbi:ATP-binding protein [Streptomyces sp. NBC_01727]|uniref:ATP-binding protein n=1 Tax=Streptomyces sp. NBC_01727 TaxID=2975924 RepID=UPI002E0F02E6|nr:ATP-binding protein [Streptomyces sp. NBC_01727]WSG86561.1 ATP-binding protein [Streptomyces sp. NBC_01727]
MTRYAGTKDAVRCGVAGTGSAIAGSPVDSRLFERALSGITAHRCPFSHRRPGNSVFVYAFSVPAIPAAVPTARKRAARVLRDWGLHEDGLYTASLVISELVGNAVQHAVSYSARTTITLTRRRTTLVLAVHDEHPFLPQPVPTTNPGRESGRGLMIVDSLAREAGGALQVRPAPHGKEMRVIFPAADFTDSADLAVCLPAA